MAQKSAIEIPLQCSVVLSKLLACAHKIQCFIIEIQLASLWLWKIQSCLCLQEIFHVAPVLVYILFTSLLKHVSDEITLSHSFA